MAACMAHGSQPLRCSLDAGIEAVLPAGCDVGSTTFAAPGPACKHTRKRLKVWKPKELEGATAELNDQGESVK